MDVKEATHTARDYITDVFADEQITNLGLEEVVYDVESEQWRITFGFARPWDRQGDMGVRMGLKAPRAYKVVRIDDSNGRVVALTDRILPKLKTSENAEEASSTPVDVPVANPGEATDGASEKLGSSEGNWDKVRQLIGKITNMAAGGDYVFRGEAKRYEHVSSGLYREYREAVESGWPLAAFEEAELQTVKLYTGEADEWTVLSSVQHYGGKTNLVDFTTDLNVALFFACDGSYSSVGRILLIERRDSESLKFHEPDVPIDRAPAQKSVFVWPQDGIVEGCEEVPVPSNPKPVVLEYLQRFHGIDHQSVYSGYHGYIKYRQRHWEAWSYLGKATMHFNKGSTATSIEHCQKAIDINPRFAEAYRCRGLAYQLEGKHDCAIADLKLALNFGPYLYPCRVELGQVYADKGDNDQAIKWYGKALSGTMPELSKDDTDKADCYNRRGMAYQKKGDYKKAVSDYTAAIDLCQPCLNLDKLGDVTMMLVGEKRHLKQFADKVRNLYAIALCNRGEAYLHSQEWDKAKADLDAAKTLGYNIPESFRADYERGVAEFECKNGCHVPEDIAELLGG